MVTVGEVVDNIEGDADADTKDNGDDEPDDVLHTTTSSEYGRSLAGYIPHTKWPSSTASVLTHKLDESSSQQFWMNQ